MISFGIVSLLSRMDFRKHLRFLLPDEVLVHSGQHKRVAQTNNLKGIKMD